MVRLPDYSLEQIRAVLDAQHFTIFENGNYNLNIVGIRNENRESDLFDDRICIFHKEEGIWKLYNFDATTDPGRSELTNPRFYEAQVGGTLIIKHNEQYRGVYTIGQMGTGNWKHTALLQTGVMKGYRDRNRDIYLDYVNEQQGIWGANIHAASLWDIQQRVGGWSAACQVIQKPQDYQIFKGLITKAYSVWGPKFSYTLLHQNLFK